MALLYDNDEYINKPLSSIVVILIYLIILIYIIILINSIYNFAIFFSNEASYNILMSEKENLNSKNITESYQYRTLNYIKCFEENNKAIENKENDDKKQKKKNDPITEENTPSRMTTLAGMASLISANEKFSLEKDFSLLFEYNLYNIIFKLICIIIFIIFFAIFINITIDFFLKKKNYTVTGNTSIYSYIVQQKNELMIKIIAIFTIAVFCYLSIYKLYFIDTVYNNIYNIYKSILQLDIFILDESNKINIIDNYFFVMLKNIVIKKSGDKYIISPDYENHIIENNIEKTANNNIKVSKYLILGFYKYIININKDIDIINKINNFIIHKNNDLETDKAISLRDYLPISLDEDNIEAKINQHFTFSKITDPKLIALLNSKKQTLISILSTLDNKLILNDVVYNIIIYISILIGLNCIIVFLIIFFVYRNEYDNADKTSDKDRNFVIIKEFIINVLEKIRKYFAKTEKEKIEEAQETAKQIEEAKKSIPMNLDSLCSGKKQETNSSSKANGKQGKDADASTFLPF